MLRLMSSTGDAMAHAILLGSRRISRFWSISYPDYLRVNRDFAALPLICNCMTILREDASLAALYLISLAIGVQIVSTCGSNVDLMHVLFLPS